MFEKRKESAEKAPEPTPVETESRSFKNNTASRVTATIGETIKIEGNITGTENLIVNGTVTGTVDLSNHDLTIGQTGKISADLIGKSVKVDGEVTGDINGSDLVVVSSCGQVRGNITAPRVTLEDGAKFKGSIDMDPVGQPQPAKVPEVNELRAADTGRA